MNLLRWVGDALLKVALKGTKMYMIWLDLVEMSSQTDWFGPRNIGKID